MKNVYYRQLSICTHLRYETARFFNNAIFLNSFTWKKELCFNFHFLAHASRPSERGERWTEETTWGRKKKKKILTIVKSLLSIKFWSLSIKDPTTGRNRTSAGEMDVFKKRGIPFKLHLLQDEERDVDILRKLKNRRIVEYDATMKVPPFIVARRI